MIKLRQNTRMTGNSLSQCLKIRMIPVILLTCVTSISGTSYAGNPIAGKTVYNRCIACHSLSFNRTGPKHCGIFGRKAGTVQDFEYSDAMRNSNIVWNSTTLDTFLKAPLKNVPGTIMGYAGVKNEKDRADLIAYLKQASQSSQCK